MSDTILFDRHVKTLEAAVAAIAKRTYWSAYPEVPSGKFYGETAKDEQLAAFNALLNKPFAFSTPLPGASGTVGNETSPFGLPLRISYPKVNLDQLIPAAQKAMRDWSHADPEHRAGVCLEILARLNKRSFEIANAVMHTTGQGFMMAFQAGGPHAQDRGLEAIAYAWQEMSRVPSNVTWEKQVSKTDTVKLNKTYRIVPRGLAVVIGCSTFPTWNSYPGLFASLVTGNAVIVKPHPGAVLPLAITVEIVREVLREAGFDPNIVTMIVDTVEKPITKELVTRPEVKIIDYTGSSSFGEWIEQNAKQAVVYTEKTGVNSAVIDSLDDLKAVTGNLAFTLSLYSGQMCTTTQNIFIPRPRDGEASVRVGGESKSFDEIAGAIVKALDWLLGDPKRGAEILGAIQNEATAKRIEQAESEAVKAGAKILRKSSPVPNEAYPGARVRSPLVIQCDASQRELYMREMFGPIVYLIATKDTAEGLRLAGESASQLGAITMAVYSTSEDVLEQAEEIAAEAGVPLSCNLVGPIYVNQAAAFSDFHVSGANPSGNATLCDAAYVANRFRIVQSRRLVPAVVPVGA